MIQTLHQTQRQLLHKTLSRASIKDIEQRLNFDLHKISYQTIRSPETGMVMAVARADATGEPFNLGEVAVTRCAIRLDNNVTGVGYVLGLNDQHALMIAVLDALLQSDNDSHHILETLVEPLHLQQQQNKQQQQQDNTRSQVDFFTMVRGE